MKYTNCDRTSVNYLDMIAIDHTNSYLSRNSANKKIFDPRPKKRHLKGLGSDCISRAHSAIWGKLGTALQAYTLKPCNKFPQKPTSRRVNT